MGYEEQLRKAAAAHENSFGQRVKSTVQGWFDNFDVQQLIDFDATRLQLHDAYVADPRHAELERLTSPETNPELFDAISDVWRSWGAQLEGRSLDQHGNAGTLWHTNKLGLRVIKPYAHNLIDPLNYNLPFVKPNVARAINGVFRRGYRIRMDAMRLYGGNTSRTEREIASIRWKRGEHKKPMERWFGLDIVYRGSSIRYNLFPGVPFSPHHRSFPSQDALMFYITTQKVKHGDRSWNSQPFLAHTRYGDRTRFWESLWPENGKLHS